MQLPQAQPIAIIGIGCRFPGAGSPEEFWRLLDQGADPIREVPPERWEVDAFYDEQLAALGKMNTKWGGFLDQLDGFDPAFFGVSSGEAASMDPQQRLLLEVTWEALEYAGLAPGKLAGTRGSVFIGIAGNEYGSLCFSDPQKINAYTLTGNLASVATNRLSYFFDLSGPSVSVDTACSSSLVAVHMAAQSLRAGESDVAIAGGVNLILSPNTTVAMSQVWIMSSSGRCRSFDAEADGYVRGEGCGIVILKRLADALDDGDNVLAVLRGSAVNQDGRGLGLTVPNAKAQEAVIREALKNAGVEPGQVDYVEAHGIGSALPDTTEAQALKAVFGVERREDLPCLIGSVKTNIGHLEAASGIAALIKAVLCLQHQSISPHLHFKQLHPDIAANGFPFLIPTERHALPAVNRLRLFGVNSFGIGGTNAHIVLEEAPIQIPDTEIQRTHELLMLSAKSETALHNLATRYVAYLSLHPDVSLSDLCYTAQFGRAHFARRLAVVADSSEEMRQRLSLWIESTPLTSAIAGCADNLVRNMEDEREGVAENAMTGSTFSASETHNVGAVDSSARQRDERRRMLEAKGRIYVSVAEMETLEPDSNHRRRRLVLPTYPFDRKRCWISASSQTQSAGDTAHPETKHQTALLLELNATPSYQRWEVLVEYVRHEVAESLGLDANQPLDLTRGFFDMGMTSLMTIDLHSRLQAGLGPSYSLPATLIFDYSSVTALSTHLAREILSIETPATHSQSIENHRGLETVLTEIENLSEEQARALLAESLSQLSRETPQYTAAVSGEPDLR